MTCLFHYQFNNPPENFMNYSTIHIAIYKKCCQKTLKVLYPKHSPRALSHHIHTRLVV